MGELHEMIITILSALGIFRLATNIIEKFSKFGLVRMIQDRVYKNSASISHHCHRVVGNVEDVGKLENDRTYTTTGISVTRAISEDFRTKVGVSRAKTVGEDDYSLTYITISGQRFSNVRLLNVDMWEAFEVGDRIEAIIYVDGEDASAKKDRNQLKNYAKEFTQGLFGIIPTGGTKWMFLRNFTQDIEIESPNGWMTHDYYKKVMSLAIGSGFIYIIPGFIAFTYIADIPYVGSILGPAVFAISFLPSLSVIDLCHREMVENLKQYHSFIDNPEL